MKLRFSLLAIVVAGALSAGSAQAAPLQPYQMIRSLQILQDQIASGDQAALPMQQKMLGIIDDRLRQADGSEFVDPRNLRALLIYGLSGGNPRTLHQLFAKVKLEGDTAKLGEAILSYANGNLQATLETMRELDPMSLDPEVAPPAALVAATVLTIENPARAAALLDDARLLSPGTLIEEAALRRSISIAASLGDAERLARASEQYVRRFIRSPYASQFAESFVAAIVALHETVDLGMLDDVTAHMNDEQARVIYLRLARMSAIEGYDRLQDFASAKAVEYTSHGEDDQDPRALLYANMAAVTSENVSEVLDALSQIDRDRLSVKDQELLDAAIAIARAVVAGPAETAVAAPQIIDDPIETSPQQAPESGAPEADDPETEDPQETYLREMQDKLKAIDALLEKEATQ